MPEGQFELAIGVPGATHTSGTRLVGKISLQIGVWGEDPPDPGLKPGLNLFEIELEQQP